MTQTFQLRIDPASGVPFYRQVIDCVLLGLAQGKLKPGDKLPTVRQAAVDLSINPNTVIRAYKELEIRGIVMTEQGTGTFITSRPEQVDAAEVERRRQLEAQVDDFLSRAAAAGFRLQDVLGVLEERKRG
jgi:GntR family transcriptional regulator